MTRTIVYTSANNAYLDRAMVLEATLRQHHPQWEVALVLVDELSEDKRIRSALSRFDTVVRPADLGPQWDSAWIFGHDVVEACTAVKGPALMHFLRTGADRVVYLDPDTAVFAPLSSVVEALEEAPVAVTPHRLTPATTDASIRDNEMGALLCGVYNLGFLAVNNDSVGREFASWWASRLRDYCLDDTPRGLFTDQRWMDLAPVYFADLAILRDPGLNVASWNVADRPITVTKSGDYTIGGATLKFFHFTKALGVGPAMTLRYAGEDIHVAELWRWYLERLHEAGSQLPSSRPWSWANYADGTPIALRHRREYRARRDLQRHFADPYSAELRAWMERNLTD